MALLIVGKLGSISYHGPNDSNENREAYRLG